MLNQSLLFCGSNLKRIVIPKVRSMSYLFNQALTIRARVFDITRACRPYCSSLLIFLEQVAIIVHLYWYSSCKSPLLFIFIDIPRASRHYCSSLLILLVQVAIIVHLYWYSSWKSSLLFIFIDIPRAIRHYCSSLMIFLVQYAIIVHLYW